MLRSLEGGGQSMSYKTQGIDFVMNKNLFYVIYLGGGTVYDSA